METTFYPKRCREQENSEISASFPRRTSVVSASGYYSSLDSSTSCSAVNGASHTLPILTSGEIESSISLHSDHERENDEECLPSGSMRYLGGDKLYLREAATDQDDHVRVGCGEDNGGIERSPLSFTCSLIPSCALKHCESLNMGGLGGFHKRK